MTASKVRRRAQEEAEADDAPRREFRVAVDLGAGDGEVIRRAVSAVVGDVGEFMVVTAEGAATLFAPGVWRRARVTPEAEEPGSE
jgi:hypothetical protein